MRLVAASAALAAGLAATAAAQGTLLTASKALAQSEAQKAPGPLPEEILEGVPEPEEDTRLIPCETELRLSGTFYNARRPERSFATFHVVSGHVGEVYRVGERVGPFEIVSVGPQAVVLDDGGPGCYLPLAGTPAPVKKSPAKPKKKKKKKKPRKTASKNVFSKEELDAAIRPLGSDKYEIKRELLAKVVERSAKLTRTTKWKQVRGYSSVKGMRLAKLANDGLLARLGLKRGDIIKTLNGLQLSSVEGALEAQKLISSTPNLSLLIQRSGRPTTLEYRVVP